LNEKNFSHQGGPRDHADLPHAHDPGSEGRTVSGQTGPGHPEDTARARLAAIVDSSDDAIVSKTLDGVITSWNAAAERLFGYTAAEVVGRNITLIIPDDRLDEERDVLAHIRRGERVHHFETIRRAKDGRLVEISLTVSPMRDTGGRIIGASKIARDISDRRRTERALATTVQRLEVLYRLADAAGRAKDLLGVCEVGIDAILAAGATRAGVLTFDGTGAMRFRAWRNLSDGYRAAVDGHSPWTADATAPKPIVVEDVLTDPGLGALRETVAAEGIRSLAFIPLVTQGRLLGKFMMYYDTLHVFSDAEIRLAETIAQHVGFGLGRVLADTAIEGLLAREQDARREADAARLEAERRRLVSEQLARLAGLMNETLEVAVVGERVVESARQLLGVGAASLRLIGPDGSLVAIAFGGAMKEVFSPGHAVPAGPASISGLAIEQRGAVWTDDAANDPRVRLDDSIRSSMQRAGHAAVLAVPLRDKDRILGALSIGDARGRRFSAADAGILQACADQAALALANARLYEEARRQQREAKVVAEVVQRVNASLDLQTTLEHLVDGARELCDADIGRIVVRDSDGRMHLRHQVGVRRADAHDQMIIEPGRGSGGQVLLTGRPFRTDSYADDPRISAHDMAARAVDGTIAQMVVPIPGESGIAGLLYVDRREARPFTDADEAVLLRLAGHAGTAIRNSQLFSAEQAARAEADAANRGKDQFLAVLSHELRTPLNAILGWARMLRASTLDARQRAHAVEVIERNAELQGQLVGDLLDISRIAVGKMEIERAPVDLVLVVRQAAEAAVSDLDAKKLRLSLELDETAGEVFGDARRLAQVVSNVLLNAIKFTPEGGRIELRLARHEANARLTVADTGMGIDRAMLSRIFDRFEQADSSTTRKHHGLGLGLAIARQVVELHGGTIRADSEGPGKGANFTIDLPVLAVRVAPRAGVLGPRRPAVLPATLAGCRILIVDDQPDAADLVAFVLARSGAEVRVVASGNEALQAIAAEEFDVLVSDISMPDVDGYDLIRRVRSNPGRGRRPLRAVALTAHTDPEIRSRVLGAGFDACATKPLEADALTELLETLR
jgi:PAS domain S-box-containing protein